MSAFRCITNNPLLLDKGFTALEFHDTDVLGLFRMIIPEVAAGYRLLSHPLTGSIRPDITPYKTVLLSASPGAVDPVSLQLIDRATGYAERLYRLRETPLYTRWDARTREDFQLVDLSIVEQALEVAQLPR